MTDRIYKVMQGNTASYFETRAEAKMYRDNVREQGFSTVVSRGPDHWRGESFNRTLNPTPSSKAVEW